MCALTVLCFGLDYLICAVFAQVGPCIVFLDEIDAVGSKRAMTEQQSSRQTLNQVPTPPS